MKLIKSALSTLMLAAVMAPTIAEAVIVLDFEGVGNNQPVNDFYNGVGGPNYGVVFEAGAAAALVDSVPGQGIFDNAPSPNTVMQAVGGATFVVDVADGFTGGFSFFYSSTVNNLYTVTVWDGTPGESTQLGPTVTLNAQANVGCNATNVTFCNWTAVGIDFGTTLPTARSIEFGGTNQAGQVLYDNLTFGLTTPVAEPSTYAMLMLGLVAMGLVSRRRTSDSSHT